MTILKQLFCVLFFSVTIFSAFSFAAIDNEELEEIKLLFENGNTNDALAKLYVFIGEVEKENNTASIIEAKIFLADVLRDNGDYKGSNEVFNEVLLLVSSDIEKLQYIFFKKGGNFQLDAQIDSARVNYEKAIFYADKIKGNEVLRAKMHANLSGIFYLNADYENAIKHSKKAANYQDKIGNKEVEAGILNNLGSIYYMQGNFKEALSVFNRALELVGYGQSDLQKQARNMSYINMAYAYSGLGDFEKAFYYQDDFFSLNDSLQQELKYKEIAEIESKYQVATKEKEAAIEKTMRKEAEMLTYGLWIAIFVLLIGIYILFKLFKLNKKNHSLQILQEQLMHQNKLEKFKSETQSKILVATLDGRVEERKKISEILHGNVGALLSAANLHLHIGGMQFNGNAPEEIEKTQSIISEASVQVRELSHTLISAVLLKLGLGEAVKEICKKSSNSAITLHCEMKNMGRFDSDFEIKMFNIVNVLVDNILKHSEADQGTVKIEQLNGKLQILVFDNGKGFDVDAENVLVGIGLSQVEARIEVLKGTFKISSSNKGTRVFISVPINY